MAPALLIVTPLRGRAPCTRFFDFPAEIQLLVLRCLDVEELNKAKLINKKFQALANDDQLWKALTIKESIPTHVMEDTRLRCGDTSTWQKLLQTANEIMRENERLVQGSFSQMKVKIDQVRIALERQTQVLEETQRRLEQLSGRLTQMEDRGRARELERQRLLVKEEQRLSDDRWCKQNWTRVGTMEQIRLEASLELELGSDGAETKIIKPDCHEPGKNIDRGVE